MRRFPAPSDPITPQILTHNFLNPGTGKAFRWVAQGVRRPLQPFRKGRQMFR